MALDTCVENVNHVSTHEEADELYSEEIDVGEDEPHLIVSGLLPYVSESDLDGRMVLARKLGGFPSHGMVLYASNEEHIEVRLVSIPVDAKVSECVTVPGFDFEGDEGKLYAKNKVGKKKVFEKIAPHLKTTHDNNP
ncbi:hypothetical protein ACHAWF_013418 [Thalassiosira exigua]